MNYSKDGTLTMIKHFVNVTDNVCACVYLCSLLLFVFKRVQHYEITQIMRLSSLLLGNKKNWMNRTENVYLYVCVRLEVSVLHVHSEVHSDTKQQTGQVTVPL